MATANEKLAKAATDHAVDLQHYSNGVVNRIIALLAMADIDLSAQLAASLEKMSSNFSIKRLDELLVSVHAVSTAAFEAIEKDLAPELRALTAYEAAYQFELLQTVVPAQITAQIAVGAVNVEQAYTAAMSEPFRGRLLKEWMSDLDSARAKRIRDAVRTGYIENQTIPQIVQRIRGTRDKKFKNGIVHKDHVNVEIVARTAISHMASFTRERFHKKNSDLIKELVWTSTLDARTTIFCAIRDGKRYTNITHKPIGHAIPYCVAGNGCGAGNIHFGCRSTMVQVLKSYKELGIDFDEPLEDTTRASMDGQVPADTSYAEWIKEQSVERQNQVLGVTRAKLMREGGLSIDKFENNKGRTLTLDELRESNAKAFKLANL